MEALMNQARRAAHETMGSRAVTRHGTIASYDPSTYAVKVELQPDGTMTGWIPLKSICAGNGWGIHCPPAIGTAVEVHFQEADGGAGSAGLSFFNDVERPLSVQPGEVVLASQAGGRIELRADKSIVITDGQGAMITMPGDGTITSAGNWTHTGMLSANSIELTTHTHSGVQPGSGMSGAPVA